MTVDGGAAGDFDYLLINQLSFYPLVGIWPNHFVYLKGMIALLLLGDF